MNPVSAPYSTEQRIRDLMEDGYSLEQARSKAHEIEVGGEEELILEDGTPVIVTY